MLCIWLRPSTLNGTSDSDTSSAFAADRDAKSAHTVRTRVS